MDTIMTIADNLQTLINCKTDMKSAIREKGVTVSGGLSTYADAIRQIETESTITYLPIGTKFAFAKFNKTDTEHSYPNVNDVINLINPNETDMSYMFSHCTTPNITYLDTSKVTNMSYMFSHCITSIIPQLDTSKVTNMSYMFNAIGVYEYNRQKMVTIPDLDCSSVTNITDLFVETEYIFGYTPYLKSVPAFINLGKQPEIVGTDSQGFLWNVLWERDNYIKIVNALYDRAAAGYKIKKILLGSSFVENTLTDADIALATNKGWSIIS